MSIRPFDHLDVTIFGTLFTASQTWSCTFTCAKVDHSNMPGSMSVGDLVDVSTDTYNAIAASVPTKASLTTDTAITGVRTYFRPANEALAVLSGEFDGSIPGTGTPNAAPQTALVLSLLTGAPGRKNRARIYWPWGLAGRLATSATLDGLVNAMATSIIPVIRTTTSDAADGAAGPVAGNNGLLITRVRADNVLDTQRRRRDKVASTHSSAVDVTIP